jgi:hypothetical protein
MRAVRGADLDQARSARAMMSGRRKAPPISINSPRETDGVPVGAEGVEHQQHRAGVVADHACIVGAGQLADQPAYVVALAACPSADVELERDGGAHGVGRGCNCALGQHRPAEVGVQHGAGEIEHAAQARRILALQHLRNLGRDRRRNRACARFPARHLTQRCQRAPDCPNRGLVAEARDRGRAAVGAQPGRRREPDWAGKRFRALRVPVIVSSPAGTSACRRASAVLAISMSEPSVATSSARDPAGDR